MPDWSTPKLAVEGRDRAGWSVPETMENARRWSGYVCPDCRFVFRVPRDHDGKGIVCPNCRRMLRIPTAGDTPPPLLVPLRKIVAEERTGGGKAGIMKMQPRGKRLDELANHPWEQQSEPLRTVKNTPSQMRLVLLVGAVVIGLLVAGGVVLMTMGPKKGQNLPKGEAAPAAVEKTPDQTDDPEAAIRGDLSYLAEIEPLARKFLEATTVEEILPIVRHSAVAEARIRGFYPDGKINPLGISQSRAASRLARHGKLLVVTVTTRAQEKRLLTLVETPQGLKIDWESWVGWSEISWEKFLADKPVTGHVFRVKLAPVEYYNFGFSNEAKWRSYRIESSDREHAVYGYVERASELDTRIRSVRASTSANLMLSLKFPEEATSANQVLIDAFVCEGWVEEDKSP